MTIESASVMSPAYIASMMPPRVALPFTSFTPRRVRPHPPRSSKRPVDPWPSIVAPSLLLKTVLFTSDEHEIRLPSFMSAPGGKKMLTSLVASSTSKRRSCSLVAEKAPGMLGGIGGEKVAVTALMAAMAAMRAAAVAAAETAARVAARAAAARAETLVATVAAATAVTAATMVLVQKVAEEAASSSSSSCSPRDQPDSMNQQAVDRSY